MKRSHKGVLLLTTMTLLLLVSCRFAPVTESGPGVLPGKSAALPESSKNETTAGLWQGAVGEPATMLWVNPGQLRQYDQTILQKPSSPSAWAAGMDTEMRLWLVGKVETQALYGEPVVILEERDGWLKVAAVKQKTNLNELGYPGWLPADHIVTNQVYLDELATLPNVVVTKPFTLLYSDQELTSVAVELCYQTRLPLLEEKTIVKAPSSGKDTTVTACTVRLPDGGTGYLPREDVRMADEIAGSREDIVRQAKEFIGLRYIWAGTSSYGFDCSGYTMRLLQSQGLVIPRDADEQAEAGLAVDKSDLLPGDLLFFASQEGRGQIHHVSMYIGDGMMIHAPNSSSAIRIDAVDNASYAAEYWGARRYIP